MTPHAPDDQLLRALVALPGVKPDPTQSERVRTRCRARLRRARQGSISFVEPANAGNVLAICAWRLLRLVLR